MLTDFLKKSESSNVKFPYTYAVRNFESLFHKLGHDGYSLRLRGAKEIEVYVDTQYVASIWDYGTFFIVPKTLLDIPEFHFQLRRIRY